ncbi:MAG: hypothetical protein HOK81_06545 [Rhodospirillaceae bacterium]|jgi:hypothetical protein|nr:hypothetical protein [Rhodospirillaceae bacterium]
MYGGTKAICILLAVMAVAACTQSGPSVVKSTTPTVTYQYDGTEQEFIETSHQADAYCEDYGREARLEETYRNGSDHFAAYACQ